MARLIHTQFGKLFTLISWLATVTLLAACQDDALPQGYVIHTPDESYTTHLLADCQQNTPQSCDTLLISEAITDYQVVDDFILVKRLDWAYYARRDIDMQAFCQSCETQDKPCFDYHIINWPQNQVERSLGQAEFDAFLEQQKLAIPTLKKDLPHAIQSHCQAYKQPQPDSETKRYQFL